MSRYKHYETISELVREGKEGKLVEIVGTVRHWYSSGDNSSCDIDIIDDSDSIIVRDTNHSTFYGYHSRLSGSQLRHYWKTTQPLQIRGKYVIPGPFFQGRIKAHSIEPYNEDKKGNLSVVNEVECGGLSLAGGGELSLTEND